MIYKILLNIFIMQIYSNKKAYLFPFFIGVLLMLFFWWTLIFTFDSLWQLNDIREYIELFFISWGLLVWIYVSMVSLIHVLRKWPIILIDSGVLRYKNTQIPLSDIKKAHLYPMWKYYRLNIAYKMTKAQKNFSYSQIFFNKLNYKTSWYQIAIPLTWVSQKEVDELMSKIS